MARIYLKTWISRLPRKKGFGVFLTISRHRELLELKGKKKIIYKKIIFKLKG